MPLNRELLTEMELTEPDIERILAAHQETVDSHQAEAARIRREYDAYRLEVDAQRIAGQRQSVIRAALMRAGANEQAIPLLEMAVSTVDEDWEGDALRDENAALAPVREQYTAFFAQPTPLPTNPIAPPIDGSTLTLEDVRRMSPGEINDNWSLICAALAHRS